MTTTRPGSTWQCPQWAEHYAAIVASLQANPNPNPDVDADPLAFVRVPKPEQAGSEDPPSEEEAGWAMQPAAARNPHAPARALSSSQVWTTQVASRRRVCGEP